MFPATKQKPTQHRVDRGLKKNERKKKRNLDTAKRIYQQYKDL